jgi:ligand-binding sensor domain-containing protein
VVQQKNWCLVFIIWTITFNFSFAQQIFFKEVNSERGLPTDCIYDLAVDNDGLFYLGTDQGVYSFNGIQVKQIPLKDAISNSITSIVFTQNGTLWCRNFSGQIFFFENDTLRVFSSSSQLQNVEDLIDLKTINNFLYIATYNAIYIVDDNKKELIHQISIPRIETILSFNDELYVSSTIGLITIIKNSDIERKISVPHGKYRLCGNKNIYYINKVDPSGIIKTFSPSDNQARYYNQAPFKEGIYVNAINQIHDELAISTNQGTFFLHNGKWKHLNTAQNHSDILTDFQGGIWISTLDNGLIYVPSLDITTLLGRIDNENFRDIIPAPQGFFLSTSKGKVYELDFNGSILRVFDTKKGSDLEFIYFDSITQKLFTSVGHFIYPNTKSFTSFYYGKGVAIDENQNIYFGIHSLSGVIGNNKIKGVNKPELEFSEGISYYTIRSKRTRTLLYHDTIVYIAYVDKLIAYGQDKIYELKNDKGQSISVVAMTTDEQGNLWCATTLNGVYCFSNGRFVKQINTTNGLKSDQCRAIRSFDDGIYVVTISGVDRINKKDGSVFHISSLLSLDHLNISDVIKHNNYLYFVTKHGLIKTSEGNFQNLIQPKLQIKEILTNQDRITKFTKSVKLNEATVELKWDLLSYQEGDKIKLWYRLIGKNDDWQEIAPTSNSIVYNNLSPGVYTFEISLNKKDIQRAQFEIPKPFWLSWWFIVFEVLLGLIIIWITVRITQYSVRKKQVVKELLIHSQLKAIRSQMNPHFLYNVLNSLQGLIYSNKVNEAITYISMFSDHLRHTLKISETQYISIKEEIESLTTYLELEKLRFGDEFQYQIIKNPGVSDLFEIPSMIIQPFVENAMKHGLLNKNGDKRLIIRFVQNQKEWIEIFIQDNGIGREKSRLINQKRKDKPTSFATKAIDNRIDLMNKNLKKKISLEITDITENRVVTGTLVHIKIPNNNYETSMIR